MIPGIVASRRRAAGGGGGGGTDPDWASVTSLLHFDGADGSTTFTDETGKVWTRAGDTQIDTAQSKFGGASGFFDGTGDKITCGTSTDYGTADFTFEGWFRFANVSGNKFLFAHGSNDGLYAANATLVVHGASTIASAAVLTANTWTHIALVRASGVATIYKDGVAVATGAHTRNLGINFTLMGTHASGGSGMFGHADEARISQVARYTADFTPPTAPFPNS